MAGGLSFVFLHMVIHVFCNHTLCPVLFSYYSLEDISHESINKYLSNLVERSLRDLECSYCMEIKEVCVYCFLGEFVVCKMTQICLT